MNPEPGELLSGGPFTLRNLVLVMGKDQIHAPRMNVDGRGAQQPQRHRRALDVPTRTAGTDSRVPRWLAILRRFPQDEISRILFFVLVRINPGATFDARMIQMRELSIVRKRRDLEVDRSVTPVGVAVLFERFDGVSHR